MTDPTQRFSDRVDDYIKYRPGYPAEALDFILKACHVPANAAIADIGSGTGIFAKLLLDKGYQVFGVEPNEPMREGAEVFLKDYPAFSSVTGSSEQTTLPERSMDLVTAATAFHWFKPMETQAEFKRILKPDGYAALLWNVRMPDADEFAIAYENLLKQLADYRDVNEKYGSYEQLKSFFKAGTFEKKVFANQQSFDAEGLAGRARSSSFVPQASTQAGDNFFKQLTTLFNLHQVNGMITFHYQTVVYIGQM